MIKNHHNNCSNNRQISSREIQNIDPNQQLQAPVGDRQIGNFCAPPFEISRKEDAVWYLMNYKLTRMAAMYGEQLNYAVQDGAQNLQGWIRPSGPRRPREGLDDCEQGILCAGLTDEGITITFTFLLAGFLIGPGGTSIRDLMRRIGCQVKSYTDNIFVYKPITSRVFVIQGKDDQILTCLDVLLAAVDRYKDLAEGPYQGQQVSHIQKIKGYVFYYYPPPKNIVPTAAAMRGPPPSKQAKAARNYLGFQSTGSYMAYLDSICGKIAKPQSNPGLTDFIRSSLESPPEDVDDVGGIYPGLYPGKIYVEEDASTNNNILEDFDQRVSGLARAVHLKESLEVSSSFIFSDNENLNRNSFCGDDNKKLVGFGVDKNSVAQRLSFDSIPPEILYRAENLILSNPELLSGYEEMDFAAQKKFVVNLLLDYFGYPQTEVKPTNIPINTGVFIKDAPVRDSVAAVDPVLSAPMPMPKPPVQSASIASINHTGQNIDVGFSLMLPKSPQKTPTKQHFKIGAGSSSVSVMSPFRRTPFADVKNRFASGRKPLSPLTSAGNMRNRNATPEALLPNYFEQGILVDLKKIVDHVEH